MKINKFSFLFLAVVSIAGIFILMDKNQTSILTYSSVDSTDSYYLMWTNDNDEFKEEFIENVESIASEHNVHKIHAQDLTSLNQVTTLFQYENGNLVRRVRSDQSLDELKAFFQENASISINSKFGKAQYDDMILSFQEVILTHSLTSTPEDVTTEDLENNFLLLFRFYIYNNQSIKQNIDSNIPKVVPEYFILKNEKGENIKPVGEFPNINTSKLLKGDRAKVMVTYMLPKGIDVQSLTLHSLFTNETIKLSELKKYKTIHPDKFNF